MGKYQALGLLWSPSQNKYIQPGEMIELDAELAKILLRKKVVKPARYIKRKRAGKKVLDKEKGNGTNN